MTYRERLASAQTSKPGEVWMSIRKKNSLVVVRQSDDRIVVRRNLLFDNERSVLHISLANNYRPMVG